MAALTDSHFWHVPVSPEVRALSPAESHALVVGSSFAKRVKASDPEHGRRLCEHGRLHFQSCSFCEAGLPALPDPSFEEQRAHAQTWL